MQQNLILDSGQYSQQKPKETKINDNIAHELLQYIVAAINSAYTDA